MLCVNIFWICTSSLSRRFQNFWTFKLQFVVIFTFLFDYQGNARALQNLCLAFFVQNNAKSHVKIVFCCLIIFNKRWISWQFREVLQKSSDIILDIEIDMCTWHHSFELFVPHIRYNDVVKNRRSQLVLEKQVCISVLIIVEEPQLECKSQEIFILTDLFDCIIAQSSPSLKLQIEFILLRILPSIPIHFFELFYFLKLSNHFLS